MRAVTLPVTLCVSNTRFLIIELPCRVGKQDGWLEGRSLGIEKGFELGVSEQLLPEPALLCDGIPVQTRWLQCG